MSDQTSALQALRLSMVDLSTTGTLVASSKLNSGSQNLPLSPLF